MGGTLDADLRSALYGQLPSEGTTAQALQIETASRKSSSFPVPTHGMSHAPVLDDVVISPEMARRFNGLTEPTVADVSRN